MSNITHEHYKLALNGYIGLVEIAVPQSKSGKHLDNIATLYNYGKQQQAKEERAKKVEELLELYRLEKELKEKYHTSGSLYIMQHVLDEIRDVAEEIQQIEEELK